MWSRLTTWTDDRQVALYLGALLVGAVVGLAVPSVAGPTEHAVNPALGLLLYATFLAVPFARIWHALRDRRFLVTVVVVNFLCVPVVVWVLTRFIAGDQALLVGVLFVLLAPCVDYVIVFTGLAGGAADRLLAATPLLMLAQMVLLPVWLRLFAGAEVVASIDMGPFVSAFLWLIVVPLLAAGVTQWASGRSGVIGTTGRGLSGLSAGLMVPLMMVVLAVVVASQIDGVSARWRDLVAVVPVYVMFSLIMPVIGGVAGRVAGLGVASRRAVVFSAVTRNSLVVLPLVLALPAAYDLSPLVVVTQTLVELLVMVTMVRVVPKLVR
ncbi:arsenic resistance protein [uncultured Corynebacterium sp.]|uniref:arsenic resistance protein n=1 Tax=uncultured Corynebacterium sp. TaxID=159447 RepID=UPI0025E595A2|nr:arsenic resistance protein [uncultured Corynebacterium sp.]